MKLRSNSGNSISTFRDKMLVPSSRVQTEFLTLEVGTDNLYQNVGMKLPLYAAQYPRRAQISTFSQKLTGKNTFGHLTYNNLEWNLILFYFLIRLIFRLCFFQIFSALEAINMYGLPEVRDLVLNPWKRRRNSFLCLCFVTTGGQTMYPFDQMAVMFPEFDLGLIFP